MNSEQMVEQFLRHRKALQQFIEVMPDDKFDFRAWDESLSFAELAMHLAGAGDYYLSFADGVPVVRPEGDAAPKTPAEIRAYVAQKTEEQVGRIRNIEDVSRVVPMRNGELPVALVLGQMREHEAHHKGQMMMMLRMCGVKDKLFYAV